MGFYYLMLFLIILLFAWIVWKKIERIIRSAWKGCDITLNIYSL